MARCQPVDVLMVGCSCCCVPLLITVWLREGLVMKIVFMDQPVFAKGHQDYVYVDNSTQISCIILIIQPSSNQQPMHCHQHHQEWSVQDLLTTWGLCDVLGPEQMYNEAADCYACHCWHTLSRSKPSTCRPSIEEARESAMYIWPGYTKQLGVDICIIDV